MGVLNELALKHGTDKASNYHDYCGKYEKYLPFERDDSLVILEIGVAQGGSLRMWEEYYKYALCVGIDIDESCKKHESNRTKIRIGSQTDDKFLYNVGREFGPFDMIVDDGSHINNHIIYTFENLWKFLKPQGVYVMEDLVTSYWENFGGGIKNPGSAIEYLKTKIDELNFYGEHLADPQYGKRRDAELITQCKQKGYNWIGMDIESINFMNSITIITKR